MNKFLLKNVFFLQLKKNKKSIIIKPLNIFLLDSLVIITLVRTQVIGKQNFARYPPGCIKTSNRTVFTKTLSINSLIIKIQIVIYTTLKSSDPYD